MPSSYFTFAPPSPVYGEVTATANYTLTTSSALVTGMTTTLPVGVWIVWFSSSVESEGTNSTSTFGLYVGGTLKADSSRTIQPYDGGTLSAADAWGAVAIQALITLTSSTVVQIQASVAAGTALCLQRTMTWLKVG